MFGNGIFYSVSDYYKEIFGQKVYKITVDAGCTCPNRDGTVGVGGCIFCGASGSGDFASSRSLSIKEQVEKAKNLVSNKSKSGKYIVYFQNFTNTYGDKDILIEKYRLAACSKDVVGIAIATRPDCLDEDFLQALSELNKFTYVSIELGFQTQKDSSVKYIRRGYENSVFDVAVKNIRKVCPDVHIVTHVIFGLPEESVDDMLKTVSYVVDNKVDGIKISLLHILSDADISKDYLDGKFKCMEMIEYFEILSKALKMIPENIVVHRLTGDGAKKYLLAPLWTGNKKVVYNSMLKYFKENGTVQGANYKDIIL